MDNPESISVEELENAAREANAHDFIVNFPEGNFITMDIQYMETGIFSTI